MNENIETKPMTLTPFKRFCMTIGELPSSYLETMSYYEMILWFTKYLGDTVIPTINNNADAVSEVQNLFLELQDYVNNYFANLDIQTEINNKLDEMAESGELADIIAQYLEIASVLGYNTKNDLKNADNLVNGSIAKTLGNTTYNDGNGYFYKIRTITSSDEIDDEEILSLTNYPTLIAEKITEPLEDDVQSNTENIQSNTDEITDIESKFYNNKNIFENDDYYLFIGDSYGTGYSADGDVTSWCDLLAQRLGIGNNYYKFNSNGAGFVATGTGGRTFLQLLQYNISNITDRNKIKKIVVVGGYNDANYNSNYNDMVTAIETFNTYCNVQFPNARTYIACCGYNTNKTTAGGDVRDKLVRNVIPAYMSTPNLTNPCVYIGYSHLILHNSDLMSSDGFHPNEDGQKQIANKLATYLNGGSINTSIWISDLTINLTESGGHVEGFDTTQLWENELSIINDKARFWIQANVNINFPTAISIVGNQNFVLGNYSTKYLAPSRNTTAQMPVKVLVVSSSQGNNLRDGILIFGVDGKVYLQIKQLNSSGSWETITNVTQLTFYPRNVYFEREYN